VVPRGGNPRPVLSGRGMIFIGGDNLHIISVLVNNHPGVLSRVVGLFSRRGYNIESLAVGTTEREDISRITLTVEGDDYTVTQVIRQLNKLVDVLTVQNIGARDNVSRELLLVKVGYDSNTRDDIMHIVDTFRAKVIDISMDSLIIELTGDNEKINAFINLINKFDVKELVRTGLVSLERGNKTLKEYEGEL
jgi:acetolactate synthase-1/3 small subunit